MSIKRMSAVWEHSQQKGSRLLLLLALADHAADDGYCWPGIEALAKKTRMSERQTIRNIEQLERDGEIVGLHTRNSGNCYIVVTGFEREQISDALRKRFDKNQLSDILSHYQDNHISDIMCQLISDILSDITDIMVSVEPSLNRQETSKTRDKKPTSIDEFFGREMTTNSTPEPAHRAADLLTQDGRDAILDDLQRQRRERYRTEPWLSVGDWIRPRNGVTKPHLQRVLYALVEAGIPEPRSDATRRRYQTLLHDMYAEAGGEWAVIRRACAAIAETPAQYRGDVSGWPQKYVLAARETGGSAGVVERRAPAEWGE